MQTASTLITVLWIIGIQYRPQRVITGCSVSSGSELPAILQEVNFATTSAISIVKVESKGRSSENFGISFVAEYRFYDSKQSIPYRADAFRGMLYGILCLLMSI